MTNPSSGAPPRVSTVIRSAVTTTRSNLPFVAFALAPLVVLKALGISHWKLRVVLAILAEISVSNLAILVFASAISLLILFILNLLTMVAQLLTTEGRYLALLFTIALTVPLVFLLYGLGISGLQLATYAFAAPVGAIISLIASKKFGVQIEDNFGGIRFNKVWLPILTLIFIVGYITNSAPWLAPQRLDVRGQQSIYVYVLSASNGELVYLDGQWREVRRIPLSWVLNRQYCAYSSETAEVALENPPTPICP